MHTVACNTSKNLSNLVIGLLNSRDKAKAERENDDSHGNVSVMFLCKLFGLPLKVSVLLLHSNK